VRLSMLLQMSISVIPQEVLQVVAPNYLETIGPFADRLLDSAEAHLKGERVRGDAPEISALMDFRVRATAISERTVEFVMENNDADLETLERATLAGWIAADVSDLSNSADSIGTTESPDDQLLSALGGQPRTEAQDVREALGAVSAEVLIGEAMTPYHKVILPVITEIDAIVQKTLPEKLKSGDQQG
jgi:hypothetical protein